MSSWLFLWLLSCRRLAGGQIKRQIRFRRLSLGRQTTTEHATCFQVYSVGVKASSIEV